MTPLRGCGALTVALLVLGGVFLGIAFSTGYCSRPREAYLSEDGIVHVRYRTYRHATEDQAFEGRAEQERILPLAEALARAEEDFGAPFKAPVTDPRRVFPASIFVLIDVPESARRFGHYPTVRMQMVLDSNFLPDGTVDPAQGPLQDADATVWLEVKHPVEGLRPVDRTAPLREVESANGVAVFIPTYGNVDGTRFYWLDGDTQYELWHFSAATPTREEMLALVDLIASQ